MNRRPSIAAERAVILVPMALAALLALLVGCSHTGQLKFVPQTLAPADTTGGHHPERTVRESGGGVHALFGTDTVFSFQPGTGDSSRRYLGKLRDGYTADTLNIILLGDNRPGFRATRLNSQMVVIRQGLSLNPVRIVKALVTIPYAFVKGMYPDLG